MTARQSAACDAAIALYRAGGITITAAAKEAGVAVSTLRRALRRAGDGPAKPGKPASTTSATKPPTPA